MVVRRLLFVSIAMMIPVVAFADAEVSDWTGAKVHLTEGDVVNNRGVKTHYHTAGTGPLVVLLHGTGGYWFDWRDFLPSLAKQYKVVALSLRGTDESDKPPAVEDYSGAAVATDIDAVIRHFGQQKAIIIGSSPGGFFGWYFAMHYPERVERLITFGAFHPANLARAYATSPAQQKAGEYSRDYQENPGAVAEVAKQQTDANSPRRRADPPDIHQMWLEASQRTWWQGFINFYKANWPHAPYSLDSEVFGGRGKDYPKVTVPTLVVYGREDRPLPAEALNGLWSWVDSELTMLVLPGRGHTPQTEIPEFVVPRVLDWLALRIAPKFVYPPTSLIKTP